MVVVRRRRSLRVLLGVVLALGVRTAVAAPRQVTDEMRAVTHCAGHMNRPVSVPESRRCCEVSSEAGAPATMAAVPAPPPVAVFVIATLPVSTVSVVPAAPALAERHRERDGPPIYLDLRTFRC
jgi:hypothetical protein